jgi:hypothetical protein
VLTSHGCIVQLCRSVPGYQLAASSCFYCPCQRTRCDSTHRMKPSHIVRHLLKPQPKLQPRCIVLRNSTPVPGLRLTPPPRLAGFHLAHLGKRFFHPSRPRQDVFFFSVPALKSGLLTVARVTLLFLPFVFRYRCVIKFSVEARHLLTAPQAMEQIQENIIFADTNTSGLY